eukprot:101816-Lingulodinium_polyedra.AAC.1
MTWPNRATIQGIALPPKYGPPGTHYATHAGKDYFPVGAARKAISRFNLPVCSGHNHRIHYKIGAVHAQRAAATSQEHAIRAEGVTNHCNKADQPTHSHPQGWWGALACRKGAGANLQQGVWYRTHTGQQVAIAMLKA